MKKYLKYLVLLTVVALLLGTASLVTFANSKYIELTAAGEEDHLFDDAPKITSKYTEWTLSEDETTLSDGTRTFKRYDNAPPDLYVSSKEIYQYANTVDINDGPSSIISSFSKDSEIVWIDLYDYKIYYATEKGTAELDDFLSKGPSSHIVATYKRENYLRSKTLPDNAIKTLSSGKDIVIMNVRFLKNADKYTIVAQNSDATLSYIHGTVFSLNGETYYVEHSKLSNECFDADGYISFRSGSIPLIRLDDEAERHVKKALYDVRINYTLETSEKVVKDNISSLIIFWIFYVLIGFAAPIPLLAVGLIRPHSQKLREPRYWYKIAIIGAVWIVLAAILAVLLII